MPSFYGKQPNGRYFRYSSVVDSFTEMNLTREQALTHAIREWGERTGAEKIARADADENAESYEPEAAPGLRRWFGCVEWMLRCKGRHGDEEYTEARKLHDKELNEVLDLIRSGVEPVASPASEPMTKVTLGWVVKQGGDRPYLGGIYDRDDGVTGWWLYHQCGALRLTRQLAREVVRRQRAEGRIAWVVRLVKTVRPT